MTLLRASGLPTTGQISGCSVGFEIAQFSFGNFDFFFKIKIVTFWFYLLRVYNFVNKKYLDIEIKEIKNSFIYIYLYQIY